MSILKTIKNSVSSKKEQTKRYGKITEFIDAVNVVVTSVTGKTYSAIIPQQDEWTDLKYYIGDGVITVNGVIIGKAKSSETIITRTV